MTLTMLQAEPDMARLTRWADGAGLLPTRAQADIGYTLHALLHAVFADMAPKPFVLLRDAARPARLLAYSVHDETALRLQAASFAEPAALSALGGLDRLEMKRMPEAFPAGHRLGFSVRVRPTIRRDRDGDRTKVREVDAFLAATEGSQPGEGPGRGDVYKAWLLRHMADGGAQPEQLTLDGFLLGAAQRRDAARVLQVRRSMPEATFSGVLRVVDPDAFAAQLRRGVGRHLSFGFGMLLLRPAK